ncbi:MAG TPA: zinc-binding dehydrogenase [Kofleriaceae bacterium]|nr:zinc-binding dehydrogenase [Kofleriaceae bacterium]
MIRAATTSKTVESPGAARADLEQFAQPSSGQDGPHRPVRPDEGAAQVSVATRAIGIDLADLLVRLGAAADGPPLPGALGLELSGVVTRAGGGLRAGDPVMGVTGGGAWADEVVAPAARFVKLPAGWSFEQGAAFPVSYLYAFELLWVMGSARPGTRVLVHGAAGPVGQAVAQVGRALGCELVGTAAREKHALVESLGVVPVDPAGFAARVRRLTGGRGVDLVLDPVGGDHWRESYEALAPGGRLVAYGPHPPVAAARARPLLRMVTSFLRAPRYSLLDLLADGKGLLGVNLDHVFDDPARMRRRFEQILALPGISPAVGALFPVDELGQALALLQSGQSVGKVVLTLDPP